VVGIVRATSQSPTPFSDDAQLTAKARMVYTMRDSDQCDSGVHFNWVDARPGDRWDLDESPSLPEFVSVPLPAPFNFYNKSYDHLWINDHGTVLFGDDNLYDDSSPSGTPPIPNSTILDPNGAIYLGWGNFYWHPSDQDPETAVYTYHDTSNGRNWFVIEYYRYPNLLGEEDTMEVLLDLDTHEITMLYDVISHHNFTVAGIEEQNGLEGILYVNDNQPAQNILHNGLAIHYGLGDPGDILEVTMNPPMAGATGTPGTVVEYTLTLSSTSSVTDSYSLEIANNQWPVTLWDVTFTTPISQIGPLTPCTSQQFGVRVEVPDTTTAVQDTAVIRARSQLDPLVTASSTLITDNGTPGLSITKSGPATAQAGDPITYTLSIHNNSTASATNLVITDVLPLATTYVSGGTLVGDTVQWQVTELTGGTTIAVQFAVTALETITNSAYGVTADGGFAATGTQPVITTITPAPPGGSIYLPVVLTLPP
jgi:uncharacterized repeat protein (TIGR01451 family)